MGVDLLKGISIFVILLLYPRHKIVQAIIKEKLYLLAL